MITLRHHDRRPNTSPELYEILLVECACCGRTFFWNQPSVPHILGVFCSERCLVDHRKYKYR